MEECLAHLLAHCFKKLILCPTLGNELAKYFVECFGGNALNPACPHTAQAPLLVKPSDIQVERKYHEAQHLECPRRAQMRTCGVSQQSE